MTTWHRYKEVKPKKTDSYICCCILSNFRGGDYLLDQIILRYNVSTKSFDCDNGISVLYWTECLKWPLSLPLDPDKDDEN